MTVTKSENGTELMIAIEGRVDTSTAPQLEKEIKDSIGSVTKLVFDFAKVEYISSAGLRVLLSAQKVMNKQGEMIIANCSEGIMEIFEITGFTDILTIEYGTVMKELIIDALTDNLPQVLRFVDEQLEAANCPMKIKMQIDIAVEEIFVNIAHYAYDPEVGTATVRVALTPDPLSVDITFIDDGVPYDPLAKADPDVTLSAEERQIGGLGIFMVKKSMDDVKYEYLDGHNILTLKKGLVEK